MNQPTKKELYEHINELEKQVLLSGMRLTEEPFIPQYLGFKKDDYGYYRKNTIKLSRKETLWTVAVDNKGIWKNLTFNNMLQAITTLNAIDNSISINTLNDQQEPDLQETIKRLKKEL